MTVTTPTPTETRYRFAATDGRLWLGLGVLPMATVGVALFAAVGLLYAGAPLPVPLLLVTCGVVAGVLPVAGRPVIGWLIPAAGHATGAASGANRWTPAVLDPRAESRRSRVRRLPAEFGRCRVFDDDAGLVGVVDDGGRSVTVVFAVAGGDRFALLDPPEQARQVAAWGTALTTIAADPQVLRVQWTHRVGPETADPTGWLRNRAGDEPDVTGVEDYAAMVRDLSGRAVRHETWLAVRLAHTGGRDLTVVADRAREIAVVLLAGDLLARPLAAREIEWVLRRFADHAAPAEPVAAATAVTGSRRTEWSQLRTDDTVHRCFAVTGWPRLPVLADWLEPLLAGSGAGGAVRSVSVHLEAVAPAVAARQARADRTRARLDATERSRLGFTDTTSTAWAEADAAGTEEELLAGYRLHRVAGVITCSAAAVPALDDGCRALSGAAAAARVDLRPLHGQHHLGLVATAPLCRPAGGSR